MTQNNNVSQERAAAIAESTLYASGDWFTVQDVAGEIGIPYRRLTNSLGLLREQGLIESRKVRGIDGQQWRKAEPVPNILCMPWRRRTNEQLGIEI